MTSERDFDRIARAWLDLGPNEAPDRAIDAVLQAVETEAQVRAPLGWPFWRPTTVNRLPLLAVLAGLVIVAVGMLALSGGDQNQGPAPIASPSAAASAATVAPSTAASAAAFRFPDELRGTWTGTLREVPGLGQGPASAIRFVSTGFDMAWLFVDRDAPFGGQMDSRIVTTEPDRFSIESTRTSAMCTSGDLGHYEWSISGGWLRIVPLDDECDSRATILPGPWVRSIADDGPGGLGYATLFRPYFSVVLPAGDWDGRGSGTGPDELVNDSRDGGATFKVWKDLDGFADPCDIEKGRRDLAPGIDGFLAYITGDPRFSDVHQEEFTIDGHRAVALQFQIGKDFSAPCWSFDGNENDLTGVLTWMPHAATDGFWNASIGSAGDVVVTEVDGVTLVFEVGGDQNSPAFTDRATLDTIRFLDDLPTPPAP